MNKKNGSAPYDSPQDLDTFTLLIVVVVATIIVLFITVGGIFLLAQGGNWIPVGIILFAVAGFIFNYIRPYGVEIFKRLE